MARSLLVPRPLFQLSFRGLFGGKGDANKLVKPPILLFGVDGRYASALYSAASKQKKLDAVDADLKKIADLCKTDTRFSEFLTNPLVKANVKKDILSKALTTKLKLTDLTINLVSLMAENGRLKYLPNVAKSFNRVMSVARGEMECTVTTAKPLDEATRKDVEESLRGFTKSKKVSLNLKVDPDIIGGMIVDFGGQHYIDMSIRSKFNLYSNLIKLAV